MSEVVAIRVYCPDGAPVAEGALSEACGGFTTLRDCRGGWVPEGRATPLVEPVDVVTATVDTADLDRPVDDVARTAAGAVKRATDEESVMWEVRPVDMVGFE